ERAYPRQVVDDGRPKVGQRRQSRVPGIPGQVPDHSDNTGCKRHNRRRLGAGQRERVYGEAAVTGSVGVWMCGCVDVWVYRSYWSYKSHEAQPHSHTPIHPYTHTPLSWEIRMTSVRIGV